MTTTMSLLREYALEARLSMTCQRMTNTCMYAPSAPLLFSYPDGFGLLQSKKQTSKCLTITQLPADTPAPISGNGTGFVPFHLADCPTLNSFSDLNNADTSAPIHYSWFSIGGISDKGVYKIDYKGNSTDPVPFVQGSAPVGSPAEAYYGFIGPQYGHLELKA